MEPVARGARRSFRRDHVGLLVLVAIVGAVQLFPGPLPRWLYGFGAVSGAFLALQAIGVILVYRTSRVVNFAQVQVGVVAATLFTTLVQYRPLLRAFTAVCPGCQVTPTMINVNYWLSLVLSMAAALLIAYAIYIFVVKRFAKAPRLVLTVATIFLAQLLGGIRGALPDLLTTEDQRRRGISLNAAELPFDWTFELDGARFVTASTLLLVVTALAIAGVAGYFRFSRSGAAIRAAGESPGRAATLGVNVDSMSGRVWVMAGALSAIAGLIAAMSSGPGEGAIDVSATVRILAVAVIAGMASLPLAAVAALVVGLLVQAVVFSYGTDVMLDTVLFVVIATVLCVQNYRERTAGGDLDQASEWRAAREVRPVPAELRSLPIVRGWIWTGSAVAALFLLGLPWALSVSQITIAALVVIYAMAAMSVLVVTGWVGHISLGQFAVAAVAAYVIAVLRLPFFLALPAGAMVGAIIAVVVGIPALRLRGLYLAVVTLAFAAAVPIALLSPRYLGKHLPNSINRPALFGIDLGDGRTFYYVSLFLLAVIVAALTGARRSQAARVLIAGRDNAAAAESFGVNLVRARLHGYALAGAVAGLAGALYAFHQTGVQSTAFSAEVSITIFIIAVIGGLGSIAGPLIGGVYYGILTVGGTSQVVQLLATGGGGLMLLLFLPGGIGQLVFSMRDGLLRRLAERRGILVPSLVADVAIDHRPRPRAPIAPKRRAGGGTSSVPARYRLDEQWAIQGGDGDDVAAYTRPANRERDRDSAMEPTRG